MKDIEGIQFDNDSGTSKIVAEKATLTIYKNDKSHFNNGGFFTGFSRAFAEITTNKELNRLDIRLLLLIFSYMGDKELIIGPNKQRLFSGEYYATDLYKII